MLRWVTLFFGIAYLVLFVLTWDMAVLASTNAFLAAGLVMDSFERKKS